MQVHAQCQAFRRGDPCRGAGWLDWHVPQDAAQRGIATPPRIMLELEWISVALDGLHMQPANSVEA